MAVRAAFRCQTCKNPLEFEGVPESLDSRTAGFGEPRATRPKGSASLCSRADAETRAFCRRCRAA